MKYALSDFTLGIEMMMRQPTNEKRAIKSVTVFCKITDPRTERIRIARRSFAQGPNSNSFVVTYGKPNYREREYLAMCKLAKCRPRKCWFQYFPKKKK